MALAAVLEFAAGASGPANATVIVQYSLTGAAGSYQTLGSDSADDFAFGAGIAGSQVGTSGFRLKADFSSNAPGSNDPLDPIRLISSTTTIKNTAQETRSLYLIVAGDGFTTPVAPPDITLFNDLTKTGTIDAAASVSVTALSCATQGSVLSNQTCAGTQTPDVNFTVGTLGDTSATTVSNLAAPYTVLQFISLSLSSGATISFQETSRLISNVAEPASVAVLGFSLVGLGVLRRTWRRRTRPEV